MDVVGMQHHRPFQGDQRKRAHQPMGKGVGGHQHPVYDGSVRLHRLNRGVDGCLSQREASGFSLKSQ